ncbi:MAG TPA: PKD domain-containing protein [Gaiellaceae bacterium]
MSRFLAPGLVVLILALPQSAAAAPTWLAPKDLSAGASGSDVHVALDAAGDAFAVWTRSGTAQVAQRPAGGSWSAAQNVSGRCVNASGTGIAVNAAGRAVVVWECPEGGNTIVQAATRPARGSWGAPHDLSAPGHDAHLPQVALDRAGDAVAVWARSNGTNVVVQASTQRPNGAWLASENVSGAGLDVVHPEVALDAHGNGVAVWQSSDGSSSVIRTATRTPAGSWSTPQAVSTGGSAERPQVGVDSAGDAVAVWSLDAAHVRTQAAFRRAGGSWGQPETLSGPAADALQPQVAVDPRGDAVAAWTSFDGRTYVVQSSSRPRGGAWGATQDLSPRSPDLGAPQIAFGGSGDAVAVWRGLRSAHERIQAARRPARGAWSTPAVVSRGGVDADLPDVALDAAGNAAVVWQSGNGVTWTMQAAGLDAAGPVLARVRIAGSRIPRSRIAFSVSPFDVWSGLRGQPQWSFGDGTSANGRHVNHAYSKAGRYTVRLSQADVLGNKTTVARGIVIAEPCVVPRVVGMTLAAAKAAIRRSHCRTGKVTRARSRTVRKGHVIAQRPAPGRRLADGARVDLVASRDKRR